MKKLFLLAFVATILTGCSNNYLDEKIKCKNLADEKIEEIRKNTLPLGQINIIEVNYHAPNSSCVMAWNNWIPYNSEDPANYSVIEDLTADKELDRYNGALTKVMISSEYASEDLKKFNEKMKEYFGKDATQVAY